MDLIHDTWYIQSVQTYNLNTIQVMQNTNIKIQISALTRIFLLGFLVLIVMIVLDMLFFQTNIFAEKAPKFSKRHLMRSTIIFVYAMFMLLAFINTNRAIVELSGNFRLPIERICLIGTLLTSVLFVLLFLFRTTIFSQLSLEDGIIEWGSAILLFCGSIVLAVSFAKCIKITTTPITIKFSLVILCFALFVIAMEEVSWFQRVLNFETPEGFDRNIQNEFNLHNFATNYIENAYYFGVFIFVVVLPFIYLLFPALSQIKYLQLLVARPFIIVIGTIFCAYNFDMWNIIFTQIAFFGSLLILFALFKFASSSYDSLLIVFSIFVITITQGIFLTHGDNFARLWEVTEYKEFFISLVLFLYSIDVFKHVSIIYSPENSR